MKEVKRHKDREDRREGDMKSPACPRETGWKRALLFSRTVLKVLSKWGFWWYYRSKTNYLIKLYKKLFRMKLILFLVVFVWFESWELDWPCLR